jgi:hypothetical protein
VVLVYLHSTIPRTRKAEAIAAGFFSSTSQNASTWFGVTGYKIIKFINDHIIIY